MSYELDVDIHALPGGLSDSVLFLYDASANQLATNDDGLADDETNTGVSAAAILSDFPA